MTAELALFILRVLFVAVLYAFILLVVRVIIRDLRSTPAEPSTLSPRSVPRLVVLDSDFEAIIQQQSFELRALTTIGRAASSDIVLPDTYVSNDHAVVINREGNWLIQDFESTNGTFLNRKPVRGEALISHGDVIQIGATRLKFLRS